VSLAIRRLRIRWKRPRHHLTLCPDTWRQAKGGFEGLEPYDWKLSCTVLRGACGLVTVLRAGNGPRLPDLRTILLEKSCW
jgi:hypothetical protein